MKSLGKNFSLCIWSLLSVAFLFAGMGLCSCTTGGEPVEIDPIEHDSGNSSGVASSSSDGKSSAEESSSSAPVADSSVIEMLDWVFVGFDFLATEVTQALYSHVMGSMPDQPRTGDDYPVVNVSWFDAALFCNKLSKSLGYDTAYVYSSMGSEHFLKDIEINYGVDAVRMPTEGEWEFAAHGGTTTTYYWGVEAASKYAYYGQTSGPEKVGKYAPNDYGLYDMAGNVAEWVNDWYGTYPTTVPTNYTGPSQGSARVVRGGGWSDPIKDCAPDVREKKDPLYTSSKLGFRIVFSHGLL